MRRAWGEKPGAYEYARIAGSAMLAGQCKFDRTL